MYFHRKYHPGEKKRNEFPDKKIKTMQSFILSYPEPEMFVQFEKGSEKVIQRFCGARF